VLSHCHYDHVGGLRRMLDIAPAVPVQGSSTPWTTSRRSRSADG
jgi:glyoxylase-like metal-dependent hydrolase (beta-lactamase superfamily II)